MSKKLIYGVAYNSKGIHKTRTGKKMSLAYRTWFNMIRRCYSPESKNKDPTYVGCSVSYEWHDFQKFASYFYSHPYSELGYQLDKDLLFPNNKIYSPDTCCFVPQELNSLLTDHRSARGAYPQGVYLHSLSGGFKAQINNNGKREGLGYYNSPEEAHQVYKIAKERHVKNKALEWANRIEWNVFVALMNWTLES